MRPEMCIRDRVPTVQHFITEDEIDAAMTGGSGFAGGKGLSLIHI